MASPARRRRIALLLNDLSTAYQARFLAAIEKAMVERDLNLISVLGRELRHPAEHERAQNVLFDWLSPESIDGVIMLSGAMANYCGTEGLVELVSRLKPLPACSIGLALPGIPSIVIDNRDGMRVAVDHLLKGHGRRRLAYVSGPRENAEAAERLLGYRDALEAAGIPFDPALVAYGYFTSPTGRSAMLEILARTRDFDGLVVANDYMAITAMDVLRGHGIRVSEDVLVVSFDDTPIARFAPRSLSSVAQPMGAMADRAVQALLAQMDGQTPEEVACIDVHLVLRESCGCGYLVRAESRVSSGRGVGVDLLAFLDAEREHLIDILIPAQGPVSEVWPIWAAKLIDSLRAEVDNLPGSFLRVVEETADDAAERQLSLDEVGRGIAALRARFQAVKLKLGPGVDLEKIWMKAMTIVKAATSRVEGRIALDTLIRASELRYASQKLSVALEPLSLSATLESAMPSLGVTTAYIGLREPNDMVRPLLMAHAGKSLPPAASFPVRQILPHGFPSESERWSMYLMALSFETHLLGLVAFDHGTDAFLCEALRSQLSASLRLGALHSRVVEETALRERLAHEQLLGEMAIAKRIQTSLAPKDLTVPGLQIAATMLPADEVGGDYYDVIRVDHGCFVGIGDVTGHGLGSGLIMLMIQSMVSALVRTQPSAPPRELVTQLNRVLYPNVRARLDRDDHATFMLLHFMGDRVVFAGAHEDAIVYRKARDEIELIESDGVWIGVREEIGELTHDGEFSLEPGDIVVLYTDGIVEARNAEHEQFGLERTVALVRANASESVQTILERIVTAARAFCPVQQDDMSCLVLRYAPASAASPA
jgi:DNA-binding LacI/PurR family transcriptional regulator/serine phosphatase RsbU (regulator of sigma subunit)